MGLSDSTKEALLNGVSRTPKVLPTCDLVNPDGTKINDDGQEVEIAEDFAVNNDDVAIDAENVVTDHTDSGANNLSDIIGEGNVAKNAENAKNATSAGNDQISTDEKISIKDENVTINAEMTTKNDDIGWVNDENGQLTSEITEIMKANQNN